MKIQSLLLVALAACVATGCSTSGRRGTDRQDLSVTQVEGSYSVDALYPVKGKPLVPRSPTGPGVPCQAGAPANECTINITVTGGDCETITVDDYVLMPPIGDKETITWKLMTPGYVFCQHTGDGAFFYDPNLPGNVISPVNNPSCSPTYQWKRLRTTGQDLEYYLRFRSATRICLKDPWMRN